MQFLYFRSVCLSVSLCFNGHFPGEPGLACVHWSKGWWKRWWHLELQAVWSSSQIITTNKPTPSYFTGWMPFLSPNQQCQIINLRDQNRTSGTVWTQIIPIRGGLGIKYGDPIFLSSHASTLLIRRQKGHPAWKNLALSVAKGFFLGSCLGNQLYEEWSLIKRPVKQKKEWKSAQRDADTARWL